MGFMRGREREVGDRVHMKSLAIGQTPPKREDGGCLLPFILFGVSS